MLQTARFAVSRNAGFSLPLLWFLAACGGNGTQNETQPDGAAISPSADAALPLVDAQPQAPDANPLPPDAAPIVDDPTVGWSVALGGNSQRSALMPTVGPTEPKILWEGSLVTLYSNPPMVADASLIVTSRAENADPAEGSIIVAHEVATGAIRWTTTLPIDSPGYFRSRVSGLNGTVYASRSGNAESSYIYALDRLDGSVLWRSEDLVDNGSQDGLIFTNEGDLIVGDTATVTRIRATDGTTVWRTPRGCQASNGCSAVLFGDRIYIWNLIRAGLVVQALDLASGSLLYQSEVFPTSGSAQQAVLMAAPDGTIYAPRTGHYLAALTDSGEALTTKWKVAIGGSAFSAGGIGPNGSVYTYSTEGRLIRLNPDDGSLVDTSIPLPARPFRPRVAIDDNGTVYLTLGGTTIYSFGADLSFNWQTNVKGTTTSAPVLTRGGILVVASNGGNLHAYRTRTID